MNNLPAQKHRFEVLDMFRGLFASLVFLFHLGLFTDTPIINNSFIENSDMFVDFFFVLSGFVIAYSYSSMESWQQFRLFFTKRFYRIYPLHFVMLIAFVGMEIAKNQLSPYIKVNNLNNPINNVVSFFTSLFLINSTPVPGIRDVSWNIPSWSISAEMISYVVFGSLLVFIHLSGQFTRRNLFFLAVIVLSIVGFWFITGTFQINHSYNFGFLRGILGFFTGAVCFNVFDKTNVRAGQLPVSFFTVAEIVSLVLIIFCITVGEILKPWGVIFEVLFFACIYIFSFQKGFISARLKNVELLKKLGQYSYSLYMTHALVISLFNVLFIRVLKLPPSAYSYLVFLNFLLVYLVSSWTYRNIEIRFQYKTKKSSLVQPETEKLSQET
jgi:peptidoglycan/LPS O-acetylase OafA/YrhL